MISPWSVQATTSKLVGQGAGLDDQAMVAGRLERVGQAPVDALAVVVDQRGLAVHDPVGADDLRAEGVADALVAEADAQQRDPGAKRSTTSLEIPASSGRARARAR